jgi:hypothetical protein
MERVEIAIAYINSFFIGNVGFSAGVPIQF